MSQSEIAITRENPKPSKLKRPKEEDHSTIYYS
jgi:hypothetical protein